MKNYKQTASDVLRLVGGEKNVVQVEHCSTRLRFTLADTSKVDAAALKKTAGVMGVISSGPQGSAGGERSTRAHTDSYVKKQMNIRTS